MNPEETQKHHKEFLQAFATTGHETLKALLIVSGGATVAYLTFLGTTLGNDKWFDSFGLEAARNLISAIRFYIYSVAAALLCYGFTWFSHGCYYYLREKPGNVTMILAVLCGVGCLALFVIGSHQAATAFEQAADHRKAAQSQLHLP